MRERVSTYYPTAVTAHTGDQECLTIRCFALAEYEIVVEGQGEGRPFCPPCAADCLADSFAGLLIVGAKQNEYGKWWAPEVSDLETVA